MRIENRVILADILSNIKRNGNAFIAVSGSPGSGKSYFCLDFAKTLSAELGNPFNIDWVSFGVEEFFSCVLRQSQPGQVVLADEVGTYFNSRMAMSRSNRSMSYLFQTVRSRNQIILMTVPNIAFVDSVGRTLFNYVCVCKPNFKDNKNWIQVYRVGYNRKNPSRPYMNRIMYEDKSDDTVRYATMYQTLIPDQKIIDDYEVKKKEYLDSLYKDELKAMKNKPTEKMVTKICPGCKRILRIPEGRTMTCGCGMISS